MFTQAVLLPNLGKRFNQLTLTLFGIAALTIGLVALAAVNNLTFLFLATAVVSFGFGIQYVTLNTLISISTPENAQGGALGVAWAIAGLAQTITPVFAASAFSFGASAGFAGLAFAISALISLAAMPLIITFKRSDKK